MYYDPKAKNRQKPPSYWCEFTYMSLILATLKLWSDEAFQAVSFFTVALPMMIYLVIAIFSSLLKFIQMLHVDESEQSVLFGLLSKKQGKLLLKVSASLLGYFGLYSFTGYLD